MKKLFFFGATLLLAGGLFSSCNNNESQTPYFDTTKLWPAYDVNSEKWGYINEKGVFAIPASFDEVSGFSCGLALVESGDNNFFIDKSGAMQNAGITFDAATDFYYNHAVVKLNEYVGLINNKMKTILQPTYSYLDNTSDNGLYPARIGGGEYYGYVDKSGEYKIPAMYTEAYAFINGVAVVRSGKYGLIDDNNKILINPTYDYLYNIGHGVIVYYQNGKFGVLDKNGKSIIAPIYDEINEIVDNELLPVCQSEKWGYTNTKGEVNIIPLQYGDAEPFFEGYAWVATGDGVYICIDTKGNTKFALGKGEYPVTGFHNGLALIQKWDETTYKTNTRYINLKQETIYQWEDEDSNSDWNTPARDKKEVSIKDMTLHFNSRNL